MTSHGLSTHTSPHFALFAACSAIVIQFHMAL